MGRAARYTAESIEAQLDEYVPGRWSRQAVGYLIVGTPAGELRLRTLKEAFAFTTACTDSRVCLRWPHEDCCVHPAVEEASTS